jgi:hypothetical protein
LFNQFLVAVNHLHSLTLLTTRQAMYA